MGKPQVLFLSYDGLTDPLGQSQILPYLLGLSRDYDITVVAFEKRSNYKKNKNTIKNKIDERLKWIPMSYTYHPPVFSTLYDIYRLYRTCIKLVKENKFKVVHCRSYISGIVGLKLKNKFGLKFLFDMRGFWPDERVDGNLWSLNNPIFLIIYKFFKRREIKLLLHADHVISLTEKAKELIPDFHPSLSRMGQITVIPCCVDTNHFCRSTLSNDNQEEVRKKLGMNADDFILTYLGSIGTWYMLQEMLDFFKVLSLELPEAKFLFLTPEEPGIIKQAARSRSIPEGKIIITEASREKMPELISVTDLAIFFIKPSFSKQASSPTKLGEFLSMGIPCVVNKGVGDLDMLFESNNIGFQTTSLQEDGYMEVVERLINLKKIDVLKIRQIAINQFSLERGVKSYSAIYHALM